MSQIPLVSLGIHLKPKARISNPWSLALDFFWDLECHSISLSSEKHLKYLTQVHSFLFVAHSKISWRECMSILGTPQHISFIYKEGCATLPSFSAFPSKFTNDFACHHTPGSIMECLPHGKPSWLTPTVPAPSGPILPLTLTYGS